MPVALVPVTVIGVAPAACAPPAAMIRLPWKRSSLPRLCRAPNIRGLTIVSTLRHSTEPLRLPLDWMRALDAACDARVDLVRARREVIDVLADVGRVHVVRAEGVVRKHVLVELG